MKKYWLLFSIISFLFLAAAVPVLAHNPRLVYGKSAPISAPIIISNPDISQAFYGRLKGEMEYYQFKLDANQNFYFHTLVPDIPGITKDVSAELLSADGDLRATLDAEDSSWPAYHEEFANDNYFAGPERTINLEPGTYTIKIANGINEGKYVLVVGEKEYFPPKEIWGTIINLPALKIYFERSLFLAYFNYVGLFIAVLIISILIVFFLARFIYRRVKRLMKNEKK